MQQISYLQNEGKQQKLHKDTKTKSTLLIQQIRDEDFWDEYKSSIIESSSDKSSSDESNSDQFSTDESGTEKDSCLRSGKQGEISKKAKKKLQQMTNLKWQPGAEAYLWGARGCGSTSTDKRQKKHRQELEAKASKCRSTTTNSISERANQSWDTNTNKSWFRWFVTTQNKTDNK